MSTHREDYILRQIRAAAVMLARILGLRTAGLVEEAEVQLRDAYGLLLGPQNDLVHQVDPSTAAHLLSSSDRIGMYARLVREQAEQAQGAERARLRTRARALAQEAEKRGPVDDEVRKIIREEAP